MNTTSSLQQFKTHGYVGFAYPETVRLAVANAVSSWKEFASLPTAVKKTLPYSNAGAGVGYELKDGTAGQADHKENFDVSMGGKQWLDEHVVRLGNPSARLFVLDAVVLLEQVKSLVFAFAEAVEHEFALKGFAEEVHASEDTIFARFIHYPPGQKPGTEIATAHTDRSGFTLHLFESETGLQCFTLGMQGKWVDMPVSGEQTVVIPAMQLQLRSRGELKALCHRVVSTERTEVTGRLSLVCFVQLKNEPEYDKVRWGSLQKMVRERGPGFNYPMSNEEFSELFIHEAK